MNTHKLQQYILSLCSTLVVLSSILVATPALATANPNPCPASTSTSAGDSPLLISNKNLTLIQSLDDTPCKSVSAKAGLQNMFDYFNGAWPWVIGCAAGIAVAYAVFGSIQIMLSGADSGMRQEGKSKIQWAIIGLLMVGLSGLILQTINPIHFAQ